MLTVGVTGGIGSGKSTVCDLLKARGARIFDADRVGKEILRLDPDARKQIIHEFGDASYHEDGSLNRRYLADLVFHDAGRLSAINAIVHPRVFEVFERERTAARSAGVELLVHEAALLFESGADQHVDVTVYVDAPRWIRVRRVMKRDQRTRRDVMARMKHQLPAYRGRALADFVLQNDGSIPQLEVRVDRLLVKLRELRGPAQRND